MAENDSKLEQGKSDKEFENKATIFISYSRDDEDFATEIVKGLDFAGFDTTIDQQNIIEGEEWEARLGNLIGECDTVVFLLTPSSAQSKMCKWELEQAEKIGKRVLPVLVRPLGHVEAPEQLAALHYTRFDDDRSFIDGLRVLIDALKTDLPWLQDLSRLQHRLRDWESGNRAKNRLLSGADIEDARSIVERKPAEAAPISDALFDYISASEKEANDQMDVERARIAELEQALKKADEAQQAQLQAQREKDIASKRVLRRTVAGLVIALLLAVGAGALGFYATQQQQKAEQQTKRADEQLHKAQLLQSQFLSDEALRQIERGDAATATLLALTALPGRTRPVEASPGTQTPPSILQSARKQRPFYAPAHANLHKSISALQEEVFLTIEDKPITALVFSKDRKYIASASENKTIKLWNAETGQLVRRIEEQGNGVLSLAFSPDSQYLASSSWSNSISLWNVKTGKLVRRLKGHVKAVNSISFSRSGKLLASASFDKTVRVWDVATGNHISVMSGHSGEVHVVAFSPDGTFIASGARDKTIRLWDVRSGTQTHKLDGHSSWVTALAFSPKGDYLATGSIDRTIKLWDLISYQEAATLEGHESTINSLAFSVYGTSLLSSSDDNTLRVWDVEKSRLYRVLRGHENGVKVARYSPTMKSIYSGGVDGTIRKWRSVASEYRGALQGHDNWVFDLAFSPKGNRLASASLDKTLRVWDVKARKPLASIAHKDAVLRLAYGPNGKQIATAAGDNIIRIWDINTSKLITELKGHSGEITHLAYSADGRMLASSAHDQTARLWDVATGGAKAVLQGHVGVVSKVLFAPDGQSLITSSWDYTLRKWDISSLAQENSSQNQARKASAIKSELIVKAKGWIYNIALSPDGKTLVSLSSDKLIRIWDMDAKRLVAQLTGHSDRVTKIKFSPDGRLLASGSLDHTIRLWDMVQRREVALLRGEKSGIEGLAFSPDGSILAASTKLRDIWLFALTNELSAVLHARQKIHRCLSPRQRTAFYLSPEPPRWCITGPENMDAPRANWRGKWPYHHKAWQDWLAAKDKGENPPLPDD